MAMTCRAQLTKMVGTTKVRACKNRIVLKKKNYEEVLT